MKLGPTGKFPQGKLNNNDEGGLKFAVTTQKDKIVLDFGKKVSWIGMDRALAIELGNILIHRACEL